jgi:hypothetical protein
MNRHIAIAAAAVVAVGALGVATARAEDNAERSLTREEVIANVLEARRTGELAALESGGTWTAPQTAPPLTREAVVDSVMKARASGELAAIETGVAWSAPTPAPALTREQVIQDYRSAHQHSSDALTMERSL